MHQILFIDRKQYKSMYCSTIFLKGIEIIQPVTTKERQIIEADRLIITNSGSSIQEYNFLISESDRQNHCIKNMLTVHELFLNDNRKSVSTHSTYVESRRFCIELRSENLKCSSYYIKPFSHSPGRNIGKVASKKICQLKILLPSPHDQKLISSAFLLSLLYFLWLNL